MFTDIKIARRHALGLAKTLMIATMVIGIGNKFAVITADDFDGDVVVINEYDPFS
jgi:hypothetical protein